VLSDIHRQIDAAPAGLVDQAKKAVGLDQTDIETYEPGLPVVAFRFSDTVRASRPYRIARTAGR
jgi:glutamate decarboxylase